MHLLQHKGAALATVIVQGVTTCFVIHYLKNPAIQLKLYLRNIRFGGPILWPCILLGASPALMQLTENMVAISFNTSLQKYGGDMAGCINEYFNECYAVCHALLSYNLGAKNIDRGKENISFIIDQLCQQFLFDLAYLYDFSGSSFIDFYK